MSKIEIQAAQRIKFMSKYAQRFLRSEGFTENVDCRESDFYDILTSDMDWASDEDLTELGREIVKQLRAQSESEAA